VACTVGFHNGLCCHALKKAELRILIKDYRSAFALRFGAMGRFHR
jgi:hypothetical protein